MSTPLPDLHTMRLLAQRALLDAGPALAIVAPKPVRKEKDRLFKQVTRRVER